MVEYAFILVMKTLWAQIGCMARMSTRAALLLRRDHRQGETAQDHGGGVEGATGSGEGLYFRGAG